MKRWLLGLLFVASCVDDSLCPFVTYIDGFTLVVSSSTWPSGPYNVTVTYDGAKLVFSCAVSVPVISFDGGAPPLTAPFDAGVDSRGRFSCTSGGTPTGYRASGQAGQELELNFEGTPASVHVNVRNGTETLLDQEVPLGFQIVRPDGPDCPGPLRASARLELPQ